jgi:hypothetical protein
MIDRKNIDLVNRDIDGVATPDEHARLLALMASDEDLRILHEDLTGLNAALSGVEQRKAPASLKHAIMREVEKSAYVPHRPSVIERLTGAVQTWSNLQKTLMLAGGALAAVFVVAVGITLYQAHTFNEGDLAGTLSVLGSSSDFSHATSYDITEGTSRGTITASYGRDLCLVRVTLPAPGISSAEFLYDAASVKVKAIRPSSDVASRLDVQAGKIFVSGGPVENLVAVFSSMTTSQTVVTIKVTGTDGMVSERIIPVVAPEK